MLIVTNPENTLSIIQFMSMLSVGTKVHVTVEGSDIIYIHKIDNATNILEFFAKLYQNEKHLLRVTEFTTYQGDFEVGITVKCI